MKNKKLLRTLATMAVGTVMVATSFGMTACGHKHATESDWKKDSTNHWHVCDKDDEIFDSEAHKDENNDNKCDVCGYVMKVEEEKKDDENKEDEKKATVTSVTVTVKDNAKAEVEIDKTLQLVASVVGTNNPATTVTWKSSDNNKATVNNGVVTGKGEGKVTITATSTVDTTKFGSIEIEVKAATTPTPPPPSTLLTDPVSITADGFTVTDTTNGDAIPAGEMELSDFNNKYSYLSGVKIITEANKVKLMTAGAGGAAVDGYTNMLRTGGTGSATKQNITFTLATGHYNIEVVARSTGSASGDRHAQLFGSSTKTSEGLPDKDSAPAKVVFNSVTSGTYALGGDGNLDIFEIKITPTEVLTVSKVQKRYDLALGQNSVNVDDVTVKLTEKFSETAADISTDWTVTYSLKKTDADNALDSDAPWDVSNATGDYVLTVTAVKGDVTLTDSSFTVEVRDSSTGVQAKVWNFSIEDGKAKAATGSPDGATIVYYSAKSGDNGGDDNTSKNSTDLKMNDKATTITITLSDLKAGQTISIKVSGFSGSKDDAKQDDEVGRYKTVDLKVDSASNATKASGSDTVSLPDTTAAGNVAREMGTLTYTVTADGEVVIVLKRVTGNTTRVTGFEITAE